MQLAVSEQVVRPCVAFLHTDASGTSPSSKIGAAVAAASITGESLIPKLNATEVAAVFSAPLHRFLSSRVEGSGRKSLIRHESKWQMWNGGRWLMHNFFVPRGSVEGRVSSAGDERLSLVGEGGDGYYRVWGMTARILIDSARVAYGRDPEFEHMKEFGEEAMVQRLVRRGKLAGERQSGSSMPRGQIEREKGITVSKDLDDNGGRGTKL